MIKYLTVMALLLVGVSAPALAADTPATTQKTAKDVVTKDIVTMENGDKITGSILEVNPKSVIVKTPYAGTLTIERSAVKTLQSETTVRVVRDTGEERHVFLSPVPAGKGWQETDVALPPELATRTTRYVYMGPGWTNQLAIGVVNTTGNDNTTSFTGDLTFHYLKKPQELTLKFESLYGRSNGTQTAGLMDENLVYRKDINDRWYWYADDDARYDAIKGLSTQVAVSAGLGYYLFKDDKFKLDVRAGPAFTYTHTFEGHTSVAPGAEGGVRAAYTINDRTNITHETVYDTSVLDFNDWRVHSETAANFKIDMERGLGLKLAYTDDYDNETAPNRKKNDTRLTLSLTLDF